MDVYCLHYKFSKSESFILDMSDNNFKTKFMVVITLINQQQMILLKNSDIVY